MTPIFGFHPLSLLVALLAVVIVIFTLAHYWAPVVDWKGCPKCNKAIQKDRTECPFCGAAVKK